MIRSSKTTTWRTRDVMAEEHSHGPVDVHAHFYPEAFLDLLAQRGAEQGLEWKMVEGKGPQFKVGTLATGPVGPAYVDLDARLAAMDAQGVEVHALSLSQPILDGGERAGLRRQRESALDAAALAVTQREIQARAEARLAREAVASSERALTSVRLAVTQANDVLRITILAFQAGASTNIEVIDAQRSARDTESAATQAEDAVRQARLDLLVAVGRFPK